MRNRVPRGIHVEMSWLMIVVVVLNVIVMKIVQQLLIVQILKRVSLEQDLVSQLVRMTLSAPTCKNTARLLKVVYNKSARPITTAGPKIVTIFQEIACNVLSLRNARQGTVASLLPMFNASILAKLILIALNCKRNARTRISASRQSV